MTYIALSHSRCLTDTILGSETFGDVANFSTFLLDRSSGMLFLGARDAILAVDTKKLNEKKPLKVSVVPVCEYPGSSIKPLNTGCIKKNLYVSI